jgi:hypothetical protein
MVGFHEKLKFGKEHWRLLVVVGRHRLSAGILSKYFPLLLSHLVHAHKTTSLKLFFDPLPDVQQLLCGVVSPTHCLRR